MQKYAWIIGNTASFKKQIRSKVKYFSIFYSEIEATASFKYFCSIPTLTFVH